MSMYRSQGQDRAAQDADRMTLPHQQATKLGQSVPVTEGTPLHPWSVNGNQKQPHCGSHAACRPEA